MSLTANNPRKRFDYVVTTFGGTDRAVVVFDVAMVAAHLVGLDRLNPQIAALRGRYLTAVYGGLVASPLQGMPGPRRPDDPAGASLAMAEIKVLMDRELPSRHRYETLIPWAAAKLSGALKAAEAGDERGLNTRMRRYFAARDSLVRYGTAIGQYVEATGIDIGKLSIDGAVEAAKEHGDEETVSERGEVVWRFDNGYTVQRLRTPSQLCEEGDVMQHCVGGGSYDEQVAKGGVEIYSLRGPKDHPHVTMEWKPKTQRWVQVKGKQNEAPILKYYPYLYAFLSGYTPTGAKAPDVAAAKRFTPKASGSVGTELLELAEHYKLPLLGYKEEEPPEPGDSIGANDIGTEYYREGHTAFVEIPYTASGDYHGSLYEKANYEAIRDDFADNPDLYSVYGSHGYCYLVVDARTGDEALVEVVRGLMNGGSYDEQREEALRQEAEEEAWEDWAQNDFVKAIVERVDEELEDAADEVLEWMADADMLRIAFYAMAEDANEHWEVEGVGVHIDVKDVAENGDARNLAAAILRSYDGFGTHEEFRTSMFDRIIAAFHAAFGSSGFPERASKQYVTAFVAALWRPMQFELPFVDAPKLDAAGLQVARRVEVSLDGDEDDCALFCDLAGTWTVLTRFEAAMLHATDDYDDVISKIHAVKPALVEAIRIYDTVIDPKPVVAAEDEDE